MVLRRPTVRHGRGVPQLVVAQRVLEKMAAAAHASVEDETGEALIGLYLSGGSPTVYLLDTISPDDSAVRQYHTFQQGDERQDELIWWLQENWQTTRDRRQGLFGLGTSKWDTPLRYLGDWHKQPGFMIQPSGGDLLTALNWIDDDDNGMDFLIAPIVTLDHPSTVEGSSASGNYVMIPQGDGTALRVDWWYIDRVTRLFQPIAPLVQPDTELPDLAPYPWHLLDPQRAAAELAALDADKLFHSITLWNADGEPPLEVCLLTARVGADKLLIIVTPHDYPQRPAQARVTPFLHMAAGDDLYKVFAQAWKASSPLTVETTGETLLDFIHAAEDAAGIARPVKPAPTAAPTAAASAPSAVDANEESQP